MKNADFRSSLFIRKTFPTATFMSTLASRSCRLVCAPYSCTFLQPQRRRHLSEFQWRPRWEISAALILLSFLLHVSGRTSWCNHLIDTSAKDAAAQISCSRVGKRKTALGEGGVEGGVYYGEEHVRMKKKSTCSMEVRLYMMKEKGECLFGSTTCTEAVIGCTLSAHIQTHSPWKQPLSDMADLCSLSDSSCRL